MAVLGVKDLLIATHRFKDIPMVTEHGVRFYCGTPLMGSTGHRLGTLCFVDDKPRKMEAHNCIILSNLCTLLFLYSQTPPHTRTHARTHARTLEAAFYKGRKGR